MQSRSVGRASPMLKTQVLVFSRHQGGINGSGRAGSKVVGSGNRTRLHAHSSVSQSVHSRSRFVSVRRHQTPQEHAPTSRPATSFFAATIDTSILDLTVTEVWPPKEAVAEASTLALIPTTVDPPGQRTSAIIPKRRRRARENRHRRAAADPRCRNGLRGADQKSSFSSRLSLCRESRTGSSIQRLPWHISLGGGVVVVMRY